MTADIDAVLARLRDRPEHRDAVEVIERLAAERDRLREALGEAHDELSWCECRTVGDDRCSFARALGESPVPDEPRCVSLSFDEDEAWIVGMALHGVAEDEDEGSADREATDPEGAAELARRATVLRRFAINLLAPSHPVPDEHAAPSHPTGEERGR